MRFKHMSLEEAKAFYEELKKASAEAGLSALMKIGMDDIWFFTDGLTKDYGNPKNKMAEIQEVKMMKDKVLKSLAHCRDGKCSECLYNRWIREVCQKRLIDDAIKVIDKEN